MVLESTMICIDNSDYMRNGDFVPSRFQAQMDAVYMICESKTRTNPENDVGLIALVNAEVLATLTTEIGKIVTKLHDVSLEGDISFSNSIKIAHLALKHRQEKHHKMRVVVFVGSPIQENGEEMTKLAKKLKKENVNCDIVSFGEAEDNLELLTDFISILNGKEGTDSHLINIPSGPHISDALKSSPIMRDLNEFAVSSFEPMEEDPELAMALRISMEEERNRQEKERALLEQKNDEEMLRQAILMSMEEDDEESTDFSKMDEDEIIDFALKISMHKDDVESPAQNNDKVEEKKAKCPDPKCDEGNNEHD